MANIRLYDKITEIMEKNDEKIKEVLTRGVETIYPNIELLRKELLMGKKLKIYCGYDPTSPSLHMGHLITLKKLAQFQSLGHKIIMLIGDFTGMIGDPTEKLSVRKKLSRREVLNNAKNYKKLAGKIIRFSGQNQAQMLYNSKWLDKISFKDLIDLSSNFTVQQMMSRDMFQERIRKSLPIYLHEFLYPLAQAYDSVAMDVDMEVGGNDQIFNMLCGHDLTKSLKNKEKFVLATKLLVDSSGKKMSKSEGNTVNMEDSPGEMFGKIMNWQDGMIIPGLELCTNTSLEEIKALDFGLKGGKINPKDAKAKLAKEIVSIFYNKDVAEKAENEFNRIFKKKENPSEIPEVKINEECLNILDLLVRMNLVASKSEAQRMVVQGAIKIDNKLEKDWKKTVTLKKGTIIQAGKRKFVKII